MIYESTIWEIHLFTLLWIISSCQNSHSLVCFLKAIFLIKENFSMQVPHQISIKSNLTQCRTTIIKCLGLKSYITLREKGEQKHSPWGTIFENVFFWSEFFFVRIGGVSRLSSTWSSTLGWRNCCIDVDPIHGTACGTNSTYTQKSKHWIGYLFLLDVTYKNI